MTTNPRDTDCTHSNAYLSGDGFDRVLVCRDCCAKFHRPTDESFEDLRRAAREAARRLDAEAEE